MKLLKHLEQKTTTWFIVAISFVFFLFRLPSLFEPYWYGDEGIYEVIGFALRHNLLLYRDIWDNKPPFLYLIYSIFDGDQFGVRLLSLIFGLASVIVFFILAKKLFERQISVYISTSIYAILFGLPLIEGNIANAENFMLLPILVASLLIFSQIKSLAISNPLKHAGILFASGLLLGLAFLFKIVAVFDFSAFFLFLAFAKYTKLKDIRSLTILLFPFVSGFFLPFILCVIYFFINGALSDFLHAAFTSNVGYVNYGNQLFIPQGLLIFKLIILSVITLFIFRIRRDISYRALFIFLWFPFALFNTFFSQRPYTHYLLVLLPSFCLAIGFAFSHKRFQKFIILCLVLVVLFLQGNFNYYTKTIGYYSNFFSFVFGNKTVTDYQMFFDRVTPRDYGISEFVRGHMKPSDKIFVWGNSGEIYKLTSTLPLSRYIVAYHATANKQTFDETMKALVIKKPLFIIILPNQPPLIFPSLLYKPRVTIDNAVIYERTF